MIIFINGSFGAGKTTVAELLVERLPDSLLFDPEMVGYMLRAILNPIVTFYDFQDLPPWRPLVVTVAEQLRTCYGRTLVMPMTIWHRPYFDEVVGGLRQIEPDFYHFCLLARKGTLYRRLEQRGDIPEEGSWLKDRVERCVEALPSPAFATHIDTNEKTPEEIVTAILSSLPSRGASDR